MSASTQARFEPLKSTLFLSYALLSSLGLTLVAGYKMLAIGRDYSFDDLTPGLIFGILATLSLLALSVAIMIRIDALETNGARRRLETMLDHAASLTPARYSGPLERLRSLVQHEGNYVNAFNRIMAHVQFLADIGEVSAEDFKSFCKAYGV